MIVRREYTETIKKEKSVMIMVGMQYKIILPKDYDMNIIRDRVLKNGSKTDSFPGLLFKFYLITEKDKYKNIYNAYTPLYLWDKTEGMNQFIFNGFYDNILESFGWQKINIGIPLNVKINANLSKSKFAIELTGCIEETQKLNSTIFNIFKNNLLEKSIGEFLIYNPDKWAYSQFYFYEEIDDEFYAMKNIKIYEILHISKG